MMIVCCVCGNRIPAEAALADAVVESWYNGQAQGRAVAEVLFGLYNPAGRLPISFPRTVGQIPLFYNYHPTVRWLANATRCVCGGAWRLLSCVCGVQSRVFAYVDDSNVPLWPFGHGLSFSSFNCTRFFRAEDRGWLLLLRAAGTQTHRCSCRR
jgi:beta-glucosidase